jgi:hypothetical protein
VTEVQYSVPGVKLVTSPLYHAESWPIRGTGGSSSDLRTCLDLGVDPVRQWRATTGVLNEAKEKCIESDYSLIYGHLSRRRRLLCRWV